MDLTDGEVRARLVQRDVPLGEANRLIRERDDPQVEREIGRLLDR